MKKSILLFLTAIIFIAFSAYAAGPYESANAKRRLCASVAGIAEMAYQGKSEGQPSLEWMLEDSETRSASLPSPFPELAKESIIRGYKAENRREAHMDAWSYCMDYMK